MRIIILFILLTITLIACSPVSVAGHTQPLVWQVTDVGKLEHGKEVYLENYCGACHSLSFANTRGTFGPVHDAAGTVAWERIKEPHYQGRATSAEAYIRESLLEPQLFSTPGFEVTNHHMPPYTHLPSEDIDALVYMLVRQR